MVGTRDARRRVVDATVALLATGGVGAASPAAIAERAGAGKMSIYRHFASKGSLVTQALVEHDRPHRRWLLGAGSSPRDRVLGMFERVAAVADRPGFAGCPYATTRLELHDPAHPAAVVALAHKDRLVEELAELIGRLGARDPLPKARLVVMLLDGAVVHAVLQGCGQPLLDAREAVGELLTGRADTATATGGSDGG